MTKSRHVASSHSFAFIVRDTAAMLHTSLVVALLRAHPRLMFWLATLLQAALWWLVPSLVYTSPPGELPIVLAVGHEFGFGGAFGSPLAYWLAEAAFRIGGAPLVYFMAQVCVAAAYYGVFTLARAIVSVHHATFAVLLMAGVFAFAAPTADFGPDILAMPFTVFALLNLWRAVGQRIGAAWFALALNLDLLMVTTHAGLILAAAVALFLTSARRGRRALGAAEPWLASILVVAVLVPQLIAFDLAGGAMIDLLPDASTRAFLTGLAGFAALVVLSHVGLMLLCGLAGDWSGDGRRQLPLFSRNVTNPFAARFVYFFAVVPALAAALTAGLSRTPPSPGSVAPFVVLSGLATVVLAGNTIAWPRPRLVTLAWAALVLAPPVGVVAAVVGLPWLGVSAAGASVDRPNAAMGRFFAEAFARRTGLPLSIVTGDPATAALVALGAPGRPSLYLDAASGHTSAVSPDDVRRKGAIVVWPNPDTRVQVPPAIAARFPSLVADVPRAFERAVQGRLPLLRIGWGVIRPEAETTPPDGRAAAP